MHKFNCDVVVDPNHAVIDVVFMRLERVLGFVLSKKVYTDVPIQVEAEAEALR